MPDRSERVHEKQAAADNYELPYISKSRTKEWLQNPEHFRLKYLEGLRPEETDAMVRGTRIHKAIEEYYLACLDAGRWLEPAASGALPENRQLWADFLAPYITNFIAWEKRRWDHADNEPHAYLPQSVEEEHWREDMLGIDGEPEWMGLADAILPAAGVPASPTDDGVVIVDFKTGSVPDKKYRDEGIYTELAYYSYLFEEVYKVTGVAAYYPREDDVLYQRAPHESRRERVRQAAGEMIQACRDYDGAQTFETKPGPLCKWGMDNDDESSLYAFCTQCTWGKPANNPETFKQMIEEGYSYDRIADELGCSTDAVGYWRYKMDL